MKASHPHAVSTPWRLLHMTKLRALLLRCKAHYIYSDTLRILHTERQKVTTDNHQRLRTNKSTSQSKRRRGDNIRATRQTTPKDASQIQIIQRHGIRKHRLIITPFHFRSIYHRANNHNRTPPQLLL